MKIMAQAAYCFGKKGTIILPPLGNFSSITDYDGESTKTPVKVADLVKSFKPESNNKDTMVQYVPPAAVVGAKIMFDQTKGCANQNPLTVVFEKSKNCLFICIV